LPAHSRAGNPSYLARTISGFHAAGARFLSAESGDNWGPNGLGYYMASRMLWDVNEAQHADAIMTDFLAKAFGPAQQAMQAFYAKLDGSRTHLLASEQVGGMFRALAEARKAAGSDAAIQQRLTDLVLYAH